MAAFAFVHICWTRVKVAANAISIEQVLLRADGFDDSRRYANINNFELSSVCSTRIGVMTDFSQGESRRAFCLNGCPAGLTGI